MQISARISNTQNGNDVTLVTGAGSKKLSVPAKSVGSGSAINGGEFLMLALATCYCNDLYRESERLGISIDAVEVEATADFEGIGIGARNIRYWARIT